MFELIQSMYIYVKSDMNVNNKEITYMYIEYVITCTLNYNLHVH